MLGKAGLASAHIEAPYLGQPIVARSGPRMHDNVALADHPKTG